LGQIEAPLAEYEKCGFSLTLNRDRTLAIDPLSKSEELMISCSLNIGIWGPRGNFLVDPDEDGILVHIPAQGQPFTKPTNTQYRRFVDCLCKCSL